MDQIYLEMLVLVGRQLQRIGVLSDDVRGSQLNMASDWLWSVSIKFDYRYVDMRWIFLLNFFCCWRQVAREFCPHHVSHYLGMDVHDTDALPRSVRLQAGMVITVEPGKCSEHKTWWSIYPSAIAKYCVVIRCEDYKMIILEIIISKPLMCMHLLLKPRNSIKR